MLKDVYLAGGVRTPIGAFCGALAEVPAPRLGAIAVILGAVGLPAEGLGLILAVDRVLDMCRTSVNVYSDSCAAAIIAGSEEYWEKRGKSP